MRRFEATQGIDKALSARVSRMDGAPLVCTYDITLPL